MPAAIGAETYCRFRQVASAAAAAFAQQVLAARVEPSFVGDISRRSASVFRVQAAYAGVTGVVAVADR